MRFRSTGLGQSELRGRMSDLSPDEEGLLVYHIQTYEPVEWHLRAGLEPRDIPRILKGLLKPSIFFHLIRTLIYTKKNPREPEDLLGNF